MNGGLVFLFHTLSTQQRTLPFEMMGDGTATVAVKVGCQLLVPGWAQLSRRCASKDSSHDILRFSDDSLNIMFRVLLLMREMLRMRPGMTTPVFFLPPPIWFPLGNFSRFLPFLIPHVCAEALARRRAPAWKAWNPRDRVQPIFMGST